RRSVERLRRLFQRLDFLARIAGERRLGVLLDEPIESLLRVGALARLQIGATELHQDAVDRQRSVLALRELLERVDRLIELAGARGGPTRASCTAIAPARSA